MASDLLYHGNNDHVKLLLTQDNNVNQHVTACTTAFSNEQLSRAHEAKKLHYALHPSDSVLIKTLKYGLID